MDPLVIDGGQGEGGGQILRTSLSLAVALGRPVRLHHLRRNRSRPGLRPQHLAAVRAAAAVSDAEVQGDAVGSTELLFSPRGLRPGHHEVDVGTAGSASLVIQTVLPPLMRAAEPSSLRVRGGTHNLLAPPFEFLERSFVPMVARLGPAVRVELVRAGLHPRGGGEVLVEIEPAALVPFDLLDRGPVDRIVATAIVSHLPGSVATRELAVVSRALKVAPEHLVVRKVEALSPGNALVVEVATPHVDAVFTSFGEPGLPAETVAKHAVEQVEAWLAAGVPVEAHLADQLLLPLALAGGGSFRTVAPSSHLRTNAAVITAFGAARFDLLEEGEAWRVVVSAP